MIHQETVKSIKGTTIKTAEGNTIQAIGNEPSLKVGDPVYTDGVVAYGNRRRLERPEIVEDAEKVVPIYASSCGYVKLNGNYVAKDFAAKKDRKLFASNDASWTAADGYIDISQGDGGYNAISAASYRFKPAISVESQGNYVKWIDLYTGDNRPPGVLIGRQIYEQTVINKGQKKDKDFISTGNVHTFEETDHYKFNEDGRHNVSEPRFSVTQKQEEADNPLTIVINGKRAKKISLKRYTTLAGTAYSAMRQKVQAYTDSPGDLWAAGAPPPDYVYEQGATISDARINQDGSFQAVMDVYQKGETFIYGTYQADWLTINKTIITEFPDIHHFQAAGQSAWWSDEKIRTFQDVTKTEKKLSDWGGVFIEAHAVYILTDSGIELVKTYATAKPDGDGIPKYNFEITSPGGYANYYRLSWEFRHGLLDSPPTVTTSSTGDSYNVNGISNPEIIYVTLSNTDGADKSLAITTTAGDTYNVTTAGDGGTITDAGGNTIATLPKLMTMGYTLAGVDDIRLTSCILICDWRQSAIYKVAIDKGKYGDLQEFLGGKNYRLSIMDKFNLSHGTEAL